MDWLVYWFMFPACILIAGIATFSGISGAALMPPFFLIGFPLMGIPALTTLAAIGAALFLETAGFGTGVYHYFRLVQLALESGFTAIPWNLIVWGVPGTIIGASLGPRLQGRVSERATRLFFSGLFAFIGVAFLLAFTIFSRRFT